VATPIEDIKRKLSERYLGKGGVHAIGFSRSKNTLRLYVHGDAGANRNELMEKVAKEAAPYKVEVIEEDRPSST
jgi:hypothetical protein